MLRTQSKDTQASAWDLVWRMARSGDSDGCASALYENVAKGTLLFGGSSTPKKYLNAITIITRHMNAEESNKIVLSAIMVISREARAKESSGEYADAVLCREAALVMAKILSRRNYLMQGDMNSFDEENRRLLRLDKAIVKI